MASELGLTIYNDDVTSFETVVGALVEVLNYTGPQAHQCADIVHNKGTYRVQVGKSYIELEKASDQLNYLGVNVKIE